MERKISLFSFFAFNRFLTPWIPVNRIVGVLQEIGTGGVDQPVRMCFR